MHIWESPNLDTKGPISVSLIIFHVEITVHVVLSESNTEFGLDVWSWGLETLLVEERYYIKRGEV